MDGTRADRDLVKEVWCWRGVWGCSWLGVGWWCLVLQYPEVFKFWRKVPVDHRQLCLGYGGLWTLPLVVHLPWWYQSYRMMGYCGRVSKLVI